MARKLTPVRGHLETVRRAVIGPISLANSLIGETNGDRVGYASYEVSAVTELSNGNYVVSSPEWDKGLLYDVGAVDIWKWYNGRQRCDLVGQQPHWVIRV